MALVERPLAGPGTPGTALDVLQAAGWNITLDDKGNTFVFPPNHSVVVAFLPETNTFVPGGPLWVIRAYSHLHDVAWEATFSDDTPAEFIAAFLSDLVKHEPLDPERDADSPPAR